MHIIVHSDYLTVSKIFSQFKILKFIVNLLAHLRNATTQVLHVA